MIKRFRVSAPGFWLLSETAALVARDLSHPNTPLSDLLACPFSALPPIPLLLSNVSLRRSRSIHASGVFSRAVNLEWRYEKRRSSGGLNGTSLLSRNDCWTSLDVNESRAVQERAIRVRGRLVRVIIRGILFACRGRRELTLLWREKSVSAVAFQIVCIVAR